MKKLLLFIGILLLNNSYAQLVVTDPGTKSAVASVNNTLGNLQSNISSDNQTILNELKEIKKVQDDIKTIQKKEEDALYKVPDIIKNGNLINGILDEEVNLLKLIQELKNISNTDINTLLQKIKNLINKEVSYAIDVCTDNKYRMTVEERNNYLKNVMTSLTMQSNLLKQKIVEAKKQNMLTKESEETHSNYQELMNKKITNPKK